MHWWVWILCSLTAIMSMGIVGKLSIDRYLLARFGVEPAIFWWILRDSFRRR